MSTSPLKITIIGAGNMGAAMAKGIVSSKTEHQVSICVSDVSEQVLHSLQTELPAISISLSNSEAVKNADIIILAVKPWLVEQIAANLKDTIDYQHQIIVSIAAGIDLSDLQNFFSKDATIFRIIPNTAIAVQQTVAIITSYRATEKQEQLIGSLFEKLGKVFFVEEKQLNAYMSLTSCGIAYAFNYVRASMKGGVEMGIPPQSAKEAVIQTLKGAIALLEAHDAHPDVEIDKVTTPGGITIKGLNEMEAQGFSNAVIKGLKASLLK